MAHELLPKPTRQQRLGNAFHQYVPAVAVFVVVTVAWEIVVAAFDVQVYLLPAPHVIILTLLELGTALLSRGMYTFGEGFAGYLLGCGAGFILATLAARWKIVAEALVPYAVASNAVPIIAMAPLAIVWFGVEEGSKIAIVALMCFFPMFLSAFKGLTCTAPASLELMRSYAATPIDVFLKLRLPHALPFIFNALKICTTLSMIGAIVGEFFGGPAFRALGVFIKGENAIFHNRETFAAVWVACGIGITFYLAVALIERAVMPWHASNRGGR
jgi:NitT/TauT family transport system permease protein